MGRGDQQQSGGADLLFARKRRNRAIPEPKPARARPRVIDAIRRSKAVAMGDALEGRYIAIFQDVLGDAFYRKAFSFGDRDAALDYIKQVADDESEWWPDVLIDTEAPLERAVCDVSQGDGSCGDPYPFHPDYVVFA